MKRLRIKVCNEKQVEPNFALLFCSAYLMMFTPQNKQHQLLLILTTKKKSKKNNQPQLRWWQQQQCQCLLCLIQEKWKNCKNAATLNILEHNTTFFSFWIYDQRDRRDHKNTTRCVDPLKIMYTFPGFCLLLNNLSSSVTMIVSPP